MPMRICEECVLIINDIFPGFADEQNCPGGRKDFRVREVVDIEENLWCPRLGLKGKVDMTVELEMAANGNIARQVCSSFEFHSLEDTGLAGDEGLFNIV